MASPLPTQVIDYNLSELRAYELLEVRRGVRRHIHTVLFAKLMHWLLSQQLCPNMKDYTLVTKDGREQFSKINNVDGPITLSGRSPLPSLALYCGTDTLPLAVGVGKAGSISIGGAQDRNAGHQLRVYCDALVEEHEEELIKAVRQAQVQVQQQLLATVQRQASKQGLWLTREHTGYTAWRGQCGAGQGAVHEHSCGVQRAGFGA